MPEVCLVCTDVEVQLCSSLNCCAHKVCMECAVKISSHQGGARCPQCRLLFETVTFWNQRFVVNVATNTLYDNAAPNPLVPYLAMSDEEMKLASRIIHTDLEDGNGALVASFHVPQFLYEVNADPSRVIAINDADDGNGEMVTTRTTWATTFWYDKDVYSQKLHDGEALLKSMMVSPQYPLFFMQAQVSKALVFMIALGKYHTGSYPTILYPEHIYAHNQHKHLVLATKYPADHISQILFNMGYMPFD